MSVYIITAPSIGLAKIGFARQPYARLSNLRIGSPIPIVLAALLPGSMENEKQLHSRFGRSRSHGEWFGITPELQELIDAFAVDRQSQRRRVHLLGSEDGIWPWALALFREIQSFCDRHDLAASEFGGLALGDRKFIPNLREGRRLHPETQAKVRRFMATYRPEQAEPLAKAS